MAENEIKTFWLQCPVCHQNTKTKITEKTILFDFPLFCPACSNTTMIDVVKGKMVLSEKD